MGARHVAAVVRSRRRPIRTAIPHGLLIYGVSAARPMRGCSSPLPSHHLVAAATDDGSVAPQLQQQRRHQQQQQPETRAPAEDGELSARCQWLIVTVAGDDVARRTASHERQASCLGNAGVCLNVSRRVVGNLLLHRGCFYLGPAVRMRTCHRRYARATVCGDPNSSPYSSPYRHRRLPYRRRRGI
jgi:hypothetical protein